MPPPADYHMHTPLCRHAAGEPRELAAAAVKLGLTEIGFSDHNPMPRDDFDDWRMRAAELEDYVGRVEAARREHPGLAIKLGLEVDYLPGYEDWIRELAARQPWDYLIGSVHYVSESWAIDNPAMISEWKSREPLEVWTAYFERLTQAAESGLFDIIGHADLCKKFCLLSEGGLHAAVSGFFAGGETARGGPGTEHGGPAEGVQRDLSQRADGPPGGANGGADYVRVGRSCAAGGGDELCRGGTVGAQCGLPAVLPVQPAAAGGGVDLGG